MNRLSLKVKLTALYSFFLILVICSVLAILFSLSSREILAGVQATLKKQVRESIDDVSVEDGGIRVDSDFYDLDENVYLALYDENMYFLYGKIPYGFDWHPELTDGRLQLVSQGNTKWYVYDQKIVDNDLGNMFIRGITSVNEAESSFRVTQRFALILLPLLALVTAAVCYRFTRRMLFPVKRITDTVQQIQKGTDLSRRIGLSDTNLVGTRGKERDEIYQMAATFDEMLEQLEESFQREKQFTSDVSH